MTKVTEIEARTVLETIVRDLGGRLVVHEPLSGGVGTITVHAPAKGAWKWGGSPMIVTTYGDSSPDQRTATQGYMLAVNRIALGLMPELPERRPTEHNGPERRNG